MARRDSEHRLSQSEAQAIKPVLDELSSIAKRPLSFNHLVNDWTTFVRSVERGYEDSIHEYTNDLSTRDLLERVLESSPPVVREKISHLLAHADKRFEAATEESKAPIRDRPFPWWRRLPRILSGELREGVLAEGHHL